MASRSSGPAEAYVWVWLPGATDPVVAGRLEADNNVLHFNYGRSYLQRDDAIALFTELPLRPGIISPMPGLTEPGCIRDSSPDAWGQRVILQRLTGQRGPNAVPEALSALTYLLHSGSDRAGAMDFQSSPDDYVARTSTAPLDALVDAAERLLEGQALSGELSEALLHGTSLGGARPKVVLRDDRNAHEPPELIAKLPVSTDPFPVVKAEAVAMNLAHRCGLDVARTELTTSLHRDVLLVERFDRPGTPGSIAGTIGERRLVVSALTILGLSPMQGIWATYPDLAEQIRMRFTDPDATLAELFSRIVFNVCVSNTDDHARNHAAFWDGEHLTLTPAYDISPQLRSGDTAQQAMAIGPDGARDSRLSVCRAAASIYHLSVAEANAIIDRISTTIVEQWADAADESRLTLAERDALFGRLILNPTIRYE